MLFSSCFSVPGSREQKVVYDEYSLSQFVKTSGAKSINISTLSLDSLLINAGDDSIVFHKTVSYLGKAYSDPNSPFRSEIFYDKILKAQVDSKWYTVAEKQKTVRNFKLLHQNDVGNPANDFTYLTPNGERSRMYNMEAEHLLLFFYNPECNACKEMSSALKKSSIITKEVAKGMLKVLCVYTDYDLSTWYRHLQDFPSQWIHGRDEDEYMYKNDVYDLRAIPTIYLLDRNKKVVLKDCTSLEELENKLEFE